MKPPIASHFLIAGLIASTFPAVAQEKKERSVQTTAYQTSVSQEQLRATTRRLKGEMAGLLEEFSRYQAASGELKKLTEALGELDVVTEQDMIAVVKILREASRAEQVDESKAKLVEASSGQKEIQALLRAVADRLTLQKEEAEMQRRLDNLALRQMANLRDTKRLAETGEKPEKVKHELLQVREMSKSEQEAIKKEIAMTMDALKNLAEKSESPDKEAFEKALKEGEQNLIRNQAEQAAESVKTDFAEAVKQQEELLRNMKQMAESLQERKTAEEQSRELADKMGQLADKQEQLAKKLTEGWGNENKQAVRKEQEKLSDQMELAKESLEKLNQEAASKVDQAKQESAQVAEKIRDKEAMENIDNVAKATDSQKAVAEKLEQAAEMLQQQADALAGNQDQQQGQDSQQSSEEMSQQQEAISDAVDQIMAAKGQMELAKRQLRDGSDQADARQRLDKAQQMLDQAQQEVAKAGEAVEKFVQEELKKADEGIAKTEEGIGVGSKQDQEKSRWNLDRAEGNANLALTGLQRAANRLAAKQGQQQGEQQQANQQNKGDSSRQDTNGPAGPMGRQKEEISGVSAVSKGGGGQREALSLLQQEKAPTEYEAMVQQYIRNLAEAANQE